MSSPPKGSQAVPGNANELESSKKDRQGDPPLSRPEQSSFPRILTAGRIASPTSHRLANHFQSSGYSQRLEPLKLSSYLAALFRYFQISSGKIFEFRGLQSENCDPWQPKDESTKITTPLMNSLCHFSSRNLSSIEPELQDVIAETLSPLNYLADPNFICLYHDYVDSTSEQCISEMQKLILNKLKIGNSSIGRGEVSPFESAVSQVLEKKDQDLTLAIQVGKDLLDRNNELEKNIEFLKAEALTLNEERAQLKYELERRNELFRILQNEAEEQTRRLVSVRALESLQQRIEALENENEDLRERAVNYTIRAEIQEPSDNDLVDEVLGKLSEANSHAAYLDAKLEELQKLKNEQDLELEIFREAIAASEAKVLTLSRRNEDYLTAFVMAQEKNGSLISEVAQLHKDLDQMKRLLDETMEKRDTSVDVEDVPGQPESLMSELMKSMMRSMNQSDPSGPHFAVGSQFFFTNWCSRRVSSDDTNFTSPSGLSGTLDPASIRSSVQKALRQDFSNRMLIAFAPPVIYNLETPSLESLSADLTLRGKKQWLKQWNLVDKLEMSKPLEGSDTLANWSRLATPSFGSFLEFNSGVSVRADIHNRQSVATQTSDRKAVVVAQKLNLTQCDKVAPPAPPMEEAPSVPTPAQLPATMVASPILLNMDLVTKLNRLGINAITSEQAKASTLPNLENLLKFSNRAESSFASTLSLLSSLNGLLPSEKKKSKTIFLGPELQHLNLLEKFERIDMEQLFGSGRTSKNSVESACAVTNASQSHHHGRTVNVESACNEDFVASETSEEDSELNDQSA